MQHNNFPRGSEWKKWDMHVHTPASVLSNEFGSDWDKYVKSLFQKAIQKNIVGIGITDYYFIEGYKKIKEDYLNNEDKLNELFSEAEIEYIKNILIFPNIEFRIDKLVLGSGEKGLKWNRKVNYHLLLSDLISISKIDDLIHSIKFETLASGLSEQKKSLTKANLIELGEELQKHQPEFRNHSALFVGMMNVAVDPDAITRLLESDKKTFQGKYFFGLPADEDLSTVEWRSQGHLIRKNLLKKAHFIFSSNTNTIKFGLGQKHSSERLFLDEFGTFKPCVWGSDAHSEERLFEPDEKRYTWIKAAPTFEGLKQILYEPHERVVIQENIPETKTPYLVIDKVRFVDNSGKKLFQPEWIQFNDNLNVIIGGKSSGKSLLLYHLAKAIDSNQVLEKATDVSISYDDLSREIDFEVLWKNNEIDKVSDELKKGQITFIPQLYINHLAEENGKEQLFNLIHSILLQNENFKSFYEEINTQRQQLVIEIKSLIQEILALRQTYQSLSKQIKEIGNNEQIRGEIKRLNEEITNLRKQSGFTSDEESKYQKLTDEIHLNEKQITKLEQIISNLEKFSQQIGEKGIKFLESIKIDYQNLKILPPDNTIEHLNDVLIKKLNESFKDFSLNSSKEQLKLSKENLRLQKQVEENKENLKPYQTKIKNQDLLKNQTRELDKQKAKLKELTNKQNELDLIKEQGKKNSDSLFNSYSKLLETYKKVYAKLQEPEFVNIGEGLTLQSQIEFDSERFFNAFTSLFDLRNPIRNIFNERFDESNNFIFDLEQHIGNIQIIYDKLPKVEDSERLKLKAGTIIEDLLIKLFDDYFKIEFSIEHKGDNILRMSPGKRGVVILQLILHISNARHPILIDQPEDNLDNRTIYHELKQFIREKKKKRQIILVTHNANLVVSTDAENVIVANQAGQQIGKDKREYQFEYISGPLENTYQNTEEPGILFQFGIREHVCDILEGGEEAFLKREQKYGLKF